MHLGYQPPNDQFDSKMEKKLEKKQNVTERISDRINQMQEVQSFCLREGLHNEFRENSLQQESILL